MGVFEKIFGYVQSSKCVGCGTIFTHTVRHRKDAGASSRRPLYCTPECEANTKKSVAAPAKAAPRKPKQETTVAPETTLERYLKRAGLK